MMMISITNTNMMTTTTIIMIRSLRSYNNNSHCSTLLGRSYYRYYYINNNNNFNYTNYRSHSLLSSSILKPSSSRSNCGGSNSSSIHRSYSSLLYQQQSCCCYQLKNYHQLQQYKYMSSSSSSSSGPSFFTSPLQWWRNRQETNELDKYKERIMAMANKEQWVIGDAIEELESSVNSWKAKIPGASSMNEIKVAKEMLKNLNGLVKVVGKDATYTTLQQMSHKDKLIAAVNGETTLEAMNTIIEQFYSMSLMQQVLYNRKVQNKSIPTTPDAIQALMKIEAPKLLSKEQKIKLSKQQAKRMLKRR